MSFYLHIFPTGASATKICPLVTKYSKVAPHMDIVQIPTMNLSAQELRESAKVITKQLGTKIGITNALTNIEPSHFVYRGKCLPQGGRMTIPLEHPIDLKQGFLLLVTNDPHFQIEEGSLLCPTPPSVVSSTCPPQGRRSGYLFRILYAVLALLLVWMVYRFR